MTNPLNAVAPIKNPIMGELRLTPSAAAKTVSLAAWLIIVLGMGGEATATRKRLGSEGIGFDFFFSDSVAVMAQISVNPVVTPATAPNA